MSDPNNIRKTLEAMGVPVGSWSQREESKIRMPHFERQAEMLETLAGLLRTQVEQDVSKMAELEEALARVNKAKSLRGGSVGRE